MTIDEEALGAIADASDGAFRDAVKMLEQASFLEGAITKDRITTFLSKSDEGMIEALCNEIFKGNGKEAIMMIEGYVSEGKDMKMFLSDCVSYLHKKLLDETIGKKQTWDPQMIQHLLHRLTKAYGELRTASITQLPLELAILEFLEERLVRDEKHDEREMKRKDEHKTVVSSHDSGNKYYSNISKDNKVSAAHITDEFKKEEKQKESSQKEIVSPKTPSSVDISDFLTIEKLASHWPDFIEALKPYNHSVAGVIRSTRPKAVTGDTVIIEALYPFHKDRLSEAKAHDILTTVLKKLFGANVNVEIVLGKK
jgi:DNA polymerase III gamma/tau subunit